MGNFFVKQSAHVESPGKMKAVNQGEVTGKKPDASLVDTPLYLFYL
jgi:hypothetical protein